MTHEQYPDLTIEGSTRGKSDLAVQWRCAREESLVGVPIFGLFWYIPEAPSAAENFGCIGPRVLGLILIGFGDLEFGHLVCNWG
ncbi:hypothetical protein E1A91_A02G182100v1 [Gossypium mustelinum]|uniref:Uncharacterized protein n=1 Tax=Gossypium mustelinum TaxID=34275 RepID=A0A5D3ABV4_GOSMU|nr:hypothetical protein E1A91_A02G182100v1 [Gossypium mustelinum]